MKAGGLDGEPDADGKFDQGITPGDFLMAITTAALEVDPTQDGDVVLPADRRTAVGALGARVDDGLMPREARDADVEETSKEQAEHKAYDLEQNVGGHG